MRRALHVLLVLALMPLAVAAKFTTSSFETAARVDPDGTVTLTETIAVRFLEPQHGLIRTVPFRTQGRNRTREVRLDLVSAQIAEGSRGFSGVGSRVQAQGGDWQVRLGDANIWVEGPVRYRLVYTVRGAWTPFSANDGFGDRDELYWNMSPTAWATPIQKVTGSVSFPPPKDAGVPIRVLAGPLGTRDGAQIDALGAWTGNVKLLRLQTVSPTEYRWEVLRPLAPGEATTLVLGLPKGTLSLPEPVTAQGVAPPGAEDTSRSPISPPSSPEREVPSSPLGYLAPLIPVGLFWLAVRNRLVPRQGPLVVQFEPPDGIGPAEAGLLIDGSVHQRDIVAGIVSLAQKGGARLLRNEEAGAGWTIELHELADAARLTPSELRLHEALRPFGPVIAPAGLQGEFRSSYVALSGGLNEDLVAAGLFAPKGQQGAGCVGCGLLLLAIPVSFVSLALAGLPTFGGIAAAAVVAAILMTRLKPYSQAGRVVQRKCEGLKEFIVRAQKRELNYMAERAPDQALFESLLPYAVAFDAVREWTRAFDGIDLAPPQWVDGYGADTLWLASFADDAAVSQQDWTTAVSSSDTGSGFSSGDSGFGGGWSDGGGFDSGGSSGDGGGGGGGDSW